MLCLVPCESSNGFAVLKKGQGDAAAHFSANVPGLILLCLAALLTASTASTADTLTHRQWTVDGVVRAALVYVPPQARTNAAPVVFAFHGHGGSMQSAARSFR